MSDGDSGPLLSVRLLSIRLGGALPGVAGDAPRAVSLTHRDGRLVLVGADDPEGDVLFDVLDATPLRYELRPLEDRLHVGDAAFTIPSGKGGAVQRALALARLEAFRPELEVEPELLGPYAPELDELSVALLRRWLEPGEVVLAWLGAPPAVDVPSTVGRPARVERRYCLTTERAALVAVGPVGDVLIQELPPVALSVHRETGRDRVTADGVEWLAALGDADAYRAVGELNALPRRERLLESARILRGRGSDDDDEAARALLETLTDEGDAWASVTEYALTGAPDEDEALLTDDILQKLAEEPALDEALRRWWERWRLGPEQGLLVVERLRRAGGDLARAALGLHATIRDAVRSVSKRPMVGPVDVSFAEHQLEVGDVEGARALMESLVAELPAADVLDVVSRDDDDQAAIRERLLELLSQVRGTEAAPDVPTLVELAHLAPFDRERVAALARHGAPGLAERARTVGALLAPGGLAPSDERAGGEAGARSPAPPLAEADIEDGLRHPATRRRGVVERLQTLIAEVDVPDHGALQDYCERLSPRSETHAVVADVCVTLGAPAVTTFVSRGERSVGVRVYEGSPPFLIIGGEHLDPASSQLLSPSELRFAVGAEILHLRLGHARITSSEVWAGALETGKTTLDVVFSVLPAFKIAKWAERVQSVAAHVPERAVGRLLGQTTKWLGSRRRPESSGAVDAGTEALIEAHRMMQLSADRAGLVLGGDLAGAVRAMFKLRPVYHAELSVAERIGLGEALARRHPTGERRLPDLAIRVGALIGFYLTEDYARLRAMVEARAS